MTLLTWMLTRLQEDDTSEVEGKTLIELYDFESKASGQTVIGGRRLFFDCLTQVFSNVQRIRKKTATQTITTYKGIKINPPHLDKETPFTTLADIRLPENCVVEEESENSTTYKIKTGFYIDDNAYDKLVVFNLNTRLWTLLINKKEIDLASLYISNNFELTNESITLVFKVVTLLKMCFGLKVTKSVIVTRFHQYLRVSDPHGNQKRIVRSILCDIVININNKHDACKKCTKMTFNHPDKENIQPGPSTSQAISSNSPNKVVKQKKVSRADLKSLIPDITDEMTELFLSQTDNISRNPNGRRWTQKMISVCLQWYCRSPQAYEAFRATKMLILPCASTLVLYKNKVKQDTGLDDQILQWMRAEATKREIHEEGWVGGIIIDEMSIQIDLQIAKNGDAVELCGFADVGQEGNDCAVLRTGTNKTTFGSHAMQLVFLGLTGFRFPFAHYITTGVQGTELYTVFWKAVDELQMYGFKVIYTSLDGAQSNRNFMKYNLGGEFVKPFKTQNPYNFSELVFIMDVSHVIKKIRNNILSSGTAKHHTRLCTLPSNDTIQWQMLYDCFKWDKANALQLHRRLTQEHVNLSCQSKMRNHLAEDILNSEMLHCMSQYQLYLGTKGAVLNGMIELLKQTSKLIDIFSDMRPITDEKDERLEELQTISQWFDTWKCYSKNTKLSMSYQCHEDIQSCTLGFVELCLIVLKTCKYVFVTPGLVNSDVVENIFNQQRSTYNGANSNPNALQYKRSLNSIIIGENIVSTKANAGKGRDAAMPYQMSIKNYPSKKLKH